MRRQYKVLVDINKKLFDRYPIKFPVEERVSIVTGPNGTGKTKTLEKLAEYFTEQGEKVVYLPSDRVFNFTLEEVDALEVMWSMFDEKSILEQYNLRLFPWDVANMKGEFISSGMLQVINLFGIISNLKEPSILIIDNIERNLHISILRRILGDILKQSKVKKLIVSSYSAELLEGFYDKTIDITKCVNFLEKGD